MLNAEFINPYIQGSQKVLEKICGQRPGLGKIFIKKPPYAPQKVAVTVSTTGAVKTTAVYAMDAKTGFYLASKMMGGFEINSLDDMSISSLCELANIISGNVSTAFADKGILTDITTPAYYVDNYPSLSEAVVCIPFLLAGNCTFELDVCLI